MEFILFGSLKSKIILMVLGLIITLNYSICHVEFSGNCLEHKIFISKNLYSASNEEIFGIIFDNKSIPKDDKYLKEICANVKGDVDRIEKMKIQCKKNRNIFFKILEFWSKYCKDIDVAGIHVILPCMRAFELELQNCDVTKNDTYVLGNYCCNKANYTKCKLNWKSCGRQYTRLYNEFLDLEYQKYCNHTICEMKTNTNISHFDTKHLKFNNVTVISHNRTRRLTSNYAPSYFTFTGNCYEHKEFVKKNDYLHDDLWKAIAVHDEPMPKNIKLAAAICANAKADIARKDVCDVICKTPNNHLSEIETVAFNKNCKDINIEDVHVVLPCMRQQEDKLKICDNVKNYNKLPKAQYYDTYVLRNLCCKNIDYKTCKRKALSLCNEKTVDLYMKYLDEKQEQYCKKFNCNVKRKLADAQKSRRDGSQTKYEMTEYDTDDDIEGNKTSNAEWSLRYNYWIVGISMTLSLSTEFIYAFNL